jgi:hypothetical protein
MLEIRDGVEWYEWDRTDGTTETECQCARCGSSCFFHECWSCGGEGEEEVEYEDFVDVCFRKCDWCRGTGGSWRCLSGREWCDANPLPGREEIESTALGPEEE